MKTKSKRFLNLATLCLALLGTTLLIEQPVKAEVTIVRQEQKRANTGDSTRENSEQDPYIKDYDEGYLDGYQNGQKPEAPESPEKTDKYDPESNDPMNGYNDGYGSGYSAGWRKAHENGGPQGKDNPPVTHQNKETQEETRGKGKSGSEQPEQDDKSQESTQKESQEEPTETKDSSPLDVLYGIFGTVLKLVLSWFDGI
ncbi:hypothetical protein ACEN7M_00700 [Streptococcus pyogenes]|uniref:hypothetical protein n=1 Tax=Streptococcus pyogenes TaxID=1314 RepID=UPI0010A17C93|nr:hypothetical protein [Streptococcus pyogenes]VHD89392.1 Uncharacterised protein [Streptococcus pyogenes]VHM71114.1 Uncharacterised protein [Streptococcus pyogenes]VHM89307.1 Uncharacterised protein [Streptococcus pyogenes]HEP1534708.1 hypothetical protein [Streptococcus pyogenes]HER0082080.1 hypothetical protein [Streptococcus pyogenes]